MSIIKYFKIMYKQNVYINKIFKPTIARIFQTKLKQLTSFIRKFNTERTKK